MNNFDFTKARFLFTDVDDTLTTDGQLRPATYEALWRLTEAGVKIVPVTGGCAGWCDQIVRTWPVAAVIGEGGSFYMTKADSGKLAMHFWNSQSQHQTDQQAIIAYIRSLQLGFEIHFAKDQAYRLVDVAIDYNQDCHLNSEQVAVIIACLESQGFRVKKSSIHINVAVGDFDKCEMTKRMGVSVFGLTEEGLKAQSIFIGDAPNDESMFAFFPQSVGVANIVKHLPQLKSQPRHVTQERCGAGVVELIDHWLAQVVSA